ncbi:hypothetical protein BKA58DRAFT_385845 [Alternaria rosae]|uniref:uncharacterized protein n=1 Tax=Alternaria rosae TaxID=1187941 RepID=UPI001E8E3915|nr:uncharacterized protein BKA58DRAFT_385845 [Alternaria rosae]KAH6870802.1 hypothetical protein BKA58DRAFT_385845 [Alternaria rosae]
MGLRCIMLILFPCCSPWKDDDRLTSSLGDRHRPLLLDMTSCARHRKWPAKLSGTRLLSRISIATSVSCRRTPSAAPDIHESL